MDHVSAGRRLRLSYIRDSAAIDDIIQERYPELPPGGTLAALALSHAVRGSSLTVNHVVLATDSRTGRHQGFLVAHGGAADSVPFLLLEATLMCAEAERVVTLRRMVALAILRSVGVGQPASVIAVQGVTPALCEALRDLSRRVAASALYPEPHTNVVNLTNAVLAYRIARTARQKPRFEATAAVMGRRGGRHSGRALSASPVEAGGPLMAVLDLRASSEDALIAGARWLYRSRRPRCRVQAADREAGKVVALAGPGR
jgi:hypothetical protein